MPDTAGHPIDPRLINTDFLGLRYFGRPIPIGKLSQS